MIIRDMVLVFVNRECVDETEVGIMVLILGKCISIRQICYCTHTIVSAVLDLSTGLYNHTHTSRDIKCEHELRNSLAEASKHING